MIIILNAPPNTGKDVLGELLQERTVARLVSFKYGLMRAAAGVLNTTNLMKLHTDLADREQKETPQEYLGGLTPRQFLIKISEEWIKPTLGHCYFGKAVADTLDPTHPLYVFTDGGFEEEVIALKEAQPNRKVLVIQLSRDGCTFEGDSRNYLDPFIADAWHKVHLETGDIEGGYEAIKDAIEKHSKLAYLEKPQYTNYKQQQESSFMSELMQMPEDHLKEMFSEEAMQEAEAKREAKLLEDEQPLGYDEENCDGCTI